jgi:hypothetical protein
MFDLEKDQLRKTYQLCRMGFGINALALALASATAVVGLLGIYHRDLWIWLHGQAWYRSLDTPIVWGCLIGTTLLWGRWNHASWQRRSGVLLLMCLVDIALWFVARADAVDPIAGDENHRWLRENLGEALGWGEFALLSSLSCDYLVHLGVEHASDSDKSTRSMISTGAMVWMLCFCQQTDWAQGWPLRHRMGIGLEAHLLMYGSTLIWTITIIQVTALVISAARQTSHVLAEIDRDDQDLLLSRSESHGALDTVTDYRDEGTYAS